MLDRGKLDPAADDVVIFRQLFDLMPQLGWTAQPDGWIDYYNKGWYDYTGSNFEDMQGWGWTSVHHPDWLPVCMAAWTEAISTGKPCQVEFPLRRHDGVFRWFLTRINPLMNDQGRLIRWVGINTDIQDQKDKEEEERSRVHALAELDRAKTIFVNNISHEFRTPLTLMIGPIQALLDECTNTQRVELDSLHRNAKRLLKLVNALLDFSSIEAGRYDARFVATDLCSFTREICSLFRSAIEKEGLAFEVQCENISEPAFVDRDMWEKVVLNLVSNAFKFTLSGKITVLVRQSDRNFLLSVADTGAGIPSAEQGELFQRFKRLKSQSARTHEGTGIGLAMVLELVKLHGGEISVKSTEGAGSEFTVQIPRGNAHLPQESLVSEEIVFESNYAQAFLEEANSWGSAKSADLEVVASSEQLNQHILIVDDNADMRAYLLRLLSPLWSAEAAPNGKAALSAAERRLPDLIVADIMMPDMDGFELLRQIRADDTLKTVPVVFLSARAGDEARAEGLEAGANDYLVKPFTARELYARVIALLQQRLFSFNLERAVDERTRALELALQAKSRFLTTVSHEVRTPMAGVIGLVELIKHTTAEDETRNMAEAAFESSKRLLQILNDLLEASKLQAARITLEMRNFAVRPLLAELVQLVKPEVEKKQLKIDFLVSPELPEMVCGDELRVRQILLNLLFNAVKFTDSGEIRIAAELVSWEDDILRLKLSVADTGIGISEEQQKQLFQPFVQANDSIARNYGGTGLGLSICRDLVELMGGQIGVTSVVDRGSTFWCELPFQEAVPATV